MTRPERTTLALAILVAGPFLTYLVLPAVGQLAWGNLFVLIAVPLALLGPTVFSVMGCVAVMRGGAPALPASPACRDPSAEDANPAAFDPNENTPPAAVASGSFGASARLAGFVLLLLLGLGVALFLVRIFSGGLLGPG